MISADLPRHRYWLMVRGVGMRRVWPGAIASALSGVLAVVLKRYGLFPGDIASLPLNNVGIPLGVFLSFRATQGYDRYWEARTLWGSLVNVSRIFARQTLGLVAADASEEKRQAVHRVIAFGYALRSHLSGEGDPRGEAAPFLDTLGFRQLEGKRNVPSSLLHSLTAWLRSTTDRGWLHPFHLPVIEQQLVTMSGVLGGCERILSTPLPVPFSLLAHRLVAVYCLLLPFAIVDTTGWYTPMVSAVVGFAFFGLDAIAGEIADPFRPGPNQLPLRTMCSTIEIDLRQSLDDADAGELPDVVDGLVP